MVRPHLQLGLYSRPRRSPPPSPPSISNRGRATPMPIHVHHLPWRGPSLATIGASSSLVVFGLHFPAIHTVVYSEDDHQRPSIRKQHHIILVRPFAASWELIRGSHRASVVPVLAVRAMPCIDPSTTLCCTKFSVQPWYRIAHQPATTERLREGLQPRSRDVLKRGNEVTGIKVGEGHVHSV